MALTRRMLKELGLESEVIDKIMEQHGSTLSDMITKAEAEENQKKAVESAKAEWDKNPPKINVKETDEYKELDKKYSDLMLDTKLTANKVQDKYRDFVRSKLPADKSFDEGIKAVQEEYPEFFSSDEPKKEGGENLPKKPTLSGGTPTKDDKPVDEVEKAKSAFARAFGK